jgi:hypothetical protein
MPGAEARKVVLPPDTPVTVTVTDEVKAGTMTDGATVAMSELSIDRLMDNPLVGA